ncbi:hypothetical protein [Kangiella sp.]|uniref:hypothetical protein n=1 Tax=Kangiella sp. TaxID=1920245 RepID=UPI003A8D4399
MNKLIYVLLGLSLVANGYFLFNQNTQEEKIVIKETIVEKKESRQATENKIIQSMPSKPDEGLVNEQFYLDKIAELENEIGQLKQQHADFAEKPKDGFSYKTSAAMDKELVEKLNLDMNKAVESFKNETVDPAWAFKHQDTIYEVITNSDITNQINLKDVTCKTSICKISMETFDNKQSTKVMAMMDASQLLRSNELLNGYGNQTSLEPDTNNIFMYIYVEDEESD